MTDLGKIEISTLPLDNDKLHALDGTTLGAVYSYNYDEVGTVTNNNGIVSGFSTTDYIELPQDFNSNAYYSPWEFIMKFTTGNNISDSQGIFCFYHQDTKPILCKIENNKFVYFSNGSSWTFNVTTNTTYKIKLKINNQNKIELYRDTYLNGTWDYIGDITSILGSYGNNIEWSIRIGCGTQESSNQSIGTIPFSGSIDLKETIIIVNNDTWWQYQATSSAPYADFISYIADLYADDPNADYFAELDSNYTNNFTKVGTLTDNDNVISGFSSSNYIQLPNAFSPNNSTWEYVLKFTTGNNVSDEQGLTSTLGSGDYCTPFYIASGGKLKAYMSTDGTSWNSNFSGEYLNLNSNTTYKVKCEFTGTQYKWYLWNNNTWETLKTVTYSTPVASGGTIIFGNNRGEERPFSGSIDLNESYIKINGKYWWGAIKDKFIYDSNNNSVKLPQYGNKLVTTNSGTSSSVYYYIIVK